MVGWLVVLGLVIGVGPVAQEPDREVLERWVAETLAGMTLDQKIGQVLTVGIGADIDADSAAFVALARIVTEFHVGGIVQRGAVSPAVASLQRRAGVPMLIVAAPSYVAAGLQTRPLRMTTDLDRQAIVQAVADGQDLLFDLPDAEEAFWAIAAAIERGDISLERLEHSVSRVLRAKARLGLVRVL